MVVKRFKVQGSKVREEKQEKAKTSQDINKKKRKSTTNQNKTKNSLPAIPKVTGTGQLVYGTYITIF